MFSGYSTVKRVFISRTYYITTHYGQIYVALSGVTSLERLYILGSFNVKSIRARPQLFEEYNRLRLECMLLLPNIEGVDSNTLVNIETFNQHAIDLESDRRLLNSDIIV